MKKRILSALLALCMMLTLLPAEAFAVELGESTEEQQDIALEPDTPEPGSEEPEESGTDGEAPMGDALSAEETSAGDELSAEEASTGDEPSTEEVSTEDESDSMSYADTTDSADDVLENDAVLTFDSSTGTITRCTPNGAKEIIIPEKIDGVSVTKIGNSAFNSCWSLTSITIPDSVTSIGSYAFQSCSSLTSITIPDSVTSIGSYAFQSCSGLTSIDIPDSVTSISNGAFSYCSGLTSITIPDSVTSIGSYAFQSCSSLTSITIPDSVTSIGYQAFCRCSSLTSITIPDSVTSIGNEAFADCSDLTSIDISNKVTSIGNAVFSFCNSLTSIEIPASVISIGDSAFQYCWALTSITIPDSVTSIGTYAFSRCYSLASITIPNGVTSIADRTFLDCRGLTDITIPDGVTWIGVSAFEGCSSLTSVKLPESLTSIGVSAFEGCSSLAGIKIPDNVTVISSGAFKYCWKLTSINIPHKMTMINGGAFQHSGLTSVELPDHITLIGDSAFEGCSNLISITIPDGVTWIGLSAFEGCSSLPSIKIPNNVTVINAATFKNCRNLTRIEIPDSVTSIVHLIDNGVNRFAFSGVSKDLTIYCYRGSYAETYAKSQGYGCVYLDIRSLSVSILTQEDTSVTEGFTVIWYDETGSEVGAGLTLLGAAVDKTYAFDVQLGEALASLYEQPERQTITPEDEAVRIVRLVPKEAVPIPTLTLTLTGRVLDESGRPVAGAEISVGLESGKTVDTVSGADGSFTVTVPYETVRITVQKNGYYKKALVLDLNSETADSFRMDDCVLTEVVTISDRVTLNITQRQAAEDADQAIEIPVTSAKSLTFVLTGSGGRSITDFETQGTVLLFHSGAVSANETIHIRVEDPAGAYVGASADVTLDHNRLGNVELTMTQKGSFRLGSVSGPEARLLVFNDSGKCIQSNAAQGGMSGGVMDAGEYRLVFLQKSSLLPSVPDFSYLQTLGLTAGQDYLLREITIVDGKVSPVGNCVVPALNESAFSYAVAENTFVTVNKRNAAAGEQILVRVSYELAPAKTVSDSSLHIVLPDGVSVLENSSATVNGLQIPYTYDSAKREVRVSMPGRGNATVYFYCAAVEAGSHSIGAFLTLSNGAIQPVGSAVIEVENAKLDVVERTYAAEGLIASGKTLPNSTVILYDNDEEVGRTKSNAVGSWSIQFDLVQPVYSYSYHFIRAVTEIAGLSETIRISTEEAMITYSEDRACKVTKITMYNTAHNTSSLVPIEQVTEFDFTGDSTVTPYYRIWPALYPTFTFKVEFSGDTSELSEVYVVTTNCAGEKTYVETTYDPVSGVWVGTHNYTSFYDAPVEVGATYDVEYIGVGVDAEMIEDLEDLFVSEQGEIFEQISEALSESFTVSDVDLDSDVVKATLICTDQDTQEELFSVYLQEEASLIEETVSADSLIQQGYTLCDEEANVWYREEIIITPGEQGGMPARISQEGTFAYLDEIYQEEIFLCPAGSLEATDGVQLVVSARIVPTPEFKYDDGATEYSKEKVRNAVTDELSDVAKFGGYVLEGLKAMNAQIRKDTYSAWGCWVSAFAGEKREILKRINKQFQEKIDNKAVLSAKLKRLGMTLDVIDKAEKANKASEYYAKWNNILNGNVKTWNKILSDINKTLAQPPEYCTISDSTRKDLKNKIKQLEAEINKYQVFAKVAIGILGGANVTGDLLFNKLLNAGVRNAVRQAVIAASTKGPVGWAIALASYDAYKLSEISDILGKQLTESLPTNAILKKQGEVMEKIEDITDELGKYCSKNPFSGLTNSSRGSVTPIADPSGYVYEAVSSNRLEGVEAVVSSEAGGVWNAAAYDQVNPQTTGPDGSYYWDVPQGNWRVSFTKEGYEPADTGKAASAVNGWLPVPPPQLEINVGMVSTASPAVKQAVAYTDRVEVEFSQYMDIGSVMTALSLTAGGIDLSDVDIEALDAEDNLGKTAQYATRFAAVYRGNPAGEIVVSVAGSAKNYAGRTLQSPYKSAALTASERPTGIDAPEAVSIGMYQTVNISFDLAPGVAGKELKVESLTEDLVRVITPSVTTNAYGEASIKLEGLLPGSGLIQITEPVSGVSTTIRANISLEAGIEPVTASLKDGTVVTTGMTLPVGTAVYLSTATEGAVIRYTLDNACPCKEAALQYSGPIALTKDTVLRAAAWKDDVYSATIRLELYVNATNPSGGNPGGENPGGENPGGENPGEGNPGEGNPGGGNPGGGNSGGGNSGGGNPGGGGSSSGTSYQIIVPTVSNGTVTITPKSAKFGTKVTITAAPNSGYTTDSVTITDRNGKSISVTNNGDGTYSFIMPASQVTVSVTFATIKTPWDNPFTDVSADGYYYDAVAWAVELGITQGTSATTFDPNNPCTRAQIVTFLWRAAGSPTVTTASKFTDVSSSKYYSDAVAWAVQEGITYGTSATAFSPNDTCTRAQAVTFLCRAKNSPAVSGTNSFTDVVSGAYYTDAVQWAVNTGVTKGTSTTTFSPKQTCTRAQIVTFLYRDRKG